MFGRDFGEYNDQVQPLEDRLLELERTIGRARAEQVEILARLDVMQVNTAEGDRCMEDWASNRLDVSSQVAHRLMTMAKQCGSAWLGAMGEGRVGLDRPAFLVKLERAGAPPEVIAEAAGDYSLGRLWGLVEKYRGVSSESERTRFESRYLYLQPSLDESAFKDFGLLYGVDGETVERALRVKADAFPHLPDQSQGQQLADALVAVCGDSLTGGSGEGRAVMAAEVFIDAALAAPTHGETGVTTSSGLRVGPETLSEILCDGKIRVVWNDKDNGPIRVSHQTESIPPTVRAYIWQRDQGQCSISGCRSRNRLQIHHIREQQHGGDHHPSNLLLLCWYHHHVAIHGLGFRIDPDAPTHRRRLIDPCHRRGPPGRPDQLPPSSHPCRWERSASASRTTSV